MKKHKMELSYKDLHAIKHSLITQLYKRNEDLEFKHGWTNESYQKELQDIEHETKLLERFTEKINYLKDLYKIE